MSKEAFLFALTFVGQHGFSYEVEWQNSVSLNNLTEQDFLREYAWVVLACGMREAVVRGKFSAISECFCSWRSAYEITCNSERCVQAALKVYRHEPKIRAIADTAASLAAHGFFNFKERLKDTPLLALRTLPFIGPVTQFHVAKNIGLDVAKPDRHLVRIAQLFRYSSVQEFCETIANQIGTRVALVDLVFWRFATLNRSYLDALRQFA